MGQGVKAGAAARSVGWFRPAGEANAPSFPAATLAPLGQGIIGATWLNLGETCAEGKTPEVREKILVNGTEPSGGTPQQATEAIKAEMTKWGKLIRELGIQED